MLHEEIRKRVRRKLYLLDKRELEAVEEEVDELIRRRMIMVEKVLDGCRKTNVL